MKRMLLIFLLPALSVCAQEEEAAPPSVRSNRYRLHAGAGRMQYEEKGQVLPINSTWDAPGLFLEGDLSFAPVSGRDGWVAQYGLRWSGAADATETWTEQGVDVQQNDMRMGALDLRAEGGWQIAWPGGSIHALLGLRLRSMHFERSRFDVYDEPPINPALTVTEDVKSVFLAPAIETEWVMKAGGYPMRIGLRLGAGAALWGEADNSRYGSLDAEGGIVLEAGVHAEWSLTKHGGLWTGLQFDRQRLDGSSRAIQVPDGAGRTRVGIIEWPQNTLDQVWFSIGYAASF